MSCNGPPGIRFYPSDQQLLCYYLTNKNDHHQVAAGGGGDGGGEKSGYDLIKELDLYDYEPFDLPENASYAYGCGGRKRHWYCYTKDEEGVRVLSTRPQPRVRRRRGRAAKGGYWRSCGRDREVVGPGGKAVVGMRSKFVFYLGDSVKSSVRTDWVLYEYALVDRVKASFVLCRVFVKSRGGKSISDNVLSSCAEESVAAMRHVGVQHDGALTPDSAEAKMYHDNDVDQKSNLCKYSASRELQERDTMTPISVGSVQFPLDIQLDEQARTSEATADMFLVSILEEDFLELDDLVD
ncbi:hypothetical protein Tsubulata_027781 [Turnera subulata]|uniref:NAC domain-containing protein n=1 Tax=Turnera subulata TaxID=218843 RepID=A0A9Q0G2A7_9ROSI|nr:hypothetical protein Tsubulata_027781 [Turnera subulata]